MWTETPEAQQLLGEISKDLVLQIAPEEQDLFDELLQDHLKTPAPSGAGDDELGFGDALLVAVTPVVAGAVAAVIKYLVDEVIDSAKQESSSLIAQKVKAIFNPSKEKKAESLGLTHDQLEKARAIVRKEAARRGMPPKQAEDLALRVIARMALAS